MRVTDHPLTLQFPAVARLLGGLHQDFHIVNEDLSDHAKSFATEAEAPALVAELRRAAALPPSDLKTLWWRSGAEILPRKVGDMRLLLQSAIAALDGGT